jgi:hypothetical protein
MQYVSGMHTDPVEAINPSVYDNNGNTEDDWNQVTTPPPPPHSKYVKTNICIMINIIY